MRRRRGARSRSSAAVFDGIVQFTFGWNLNIEQKRTYVGLGFSFVNVVDRLGKLIAKE